MAEYLSDHFNPTAAQSLLADPRLIPPQAVDGGYLRYKRANCTPTLPFAGGVTSADTDEMRMFTMQSSDRIHWIAMSADINSDGEYRVEIYESGVDHDGKKLTTLLFGEVNTISDRSQFEMFTNGSLTDEQRGLPLWELLGLARDPHKDWDIVIACVPLVGTTTADKFLLEVLYTGFTL